MIRSAQRHFNQTKTQDTKFPLLPFLCSFIHLFACSLIQLLLGVDYWSGAMWGPGNTQIKNTPPPRSLKKLAAWWRKGVLRKSSGSRTARTKSLNRHGRLLWGREAWALPLEGRTLLLHKVGRAWDRGVCARVFLLLAHDFPHHSLIFLNLNILCYTHFTDG